MGDTLHNRELGQAQCHDKDYCILADGLHRAIAQAA